MALHCTVVLFFYLSLALSVPRWAFVGFLSLWAAFLALGLLFLRRRSAWVAAVPVMAFGAWLLLAWAGDRLLGWTA